MPDNTTIPDSIRDEIHLSLDELVRRGAQRMLALALQAEVDEYIRRYGCPGNLVHPSENQT